jgi:N-methylhydantoinase A
VLVPAIPGCLSAFGLVVSDVTHDYVMTHLAPISDTLHLQLERIFAEFAAGAHAQLADEGIEEKRCELFRILDLRYIGEQSSVSVPVAANDADWLAATTQEFHAMHERLYGFCVLDEPVEVVNVRMRAVGRLYRPPRNGAAKPASATRSPQRIGTRMVAFGPNKGDRVETPVYERTALVPGMSFTGPAIVEQNDSTLIVPAKRIVRTDEHSNLLIEAGVS